MPVPDSDPVAALVALLGAERAGAVPVVTPGPPDPGLLTAAAGLPSRHPDAGPLLVLVTSGTSGRPRAVARTVASWAASLPGYDALLGPDAGPGTIGWAPGPASSTLTLFALWHGLATGRPMLAGRPRWDRVRAARAGTAAEAVAVHCVPAVLADLLDERAAGRLPLLRRAVVAGSPLPGRLRRRAADLGVTLAQYYGAAELSFVAADPAGRGLRTFPGAQLAVRPDGTIWVRSPYLSLGYLAGGDGAPLRRDPAGWATVGDLGELDADGVLTVRGRGDSTATVGGTTVSLADVEAALGDVPGVAELLAFAEPHPGLGERVLVVVRPDPRTPDRTTDRPTDRRTDRTTKGATGTPTGLVAVLRAAARTRLPAPARPVRYVLRDDLPRTGGGKPARAALRAQVLAVPAQVLAASTRAPVPGTGRPGLPPIRALAP